jgi:hypothetical protein
MGAVVSLETAWALAVAWYTGRSQREWRRRTPAETQALFTSVGLVGPFWRVT